MHIQYIYIYIYIRMGLGTVSYECIAPGRERRDAGVQGQGPQVRPRDGPPQARWVCGEGWPLVGSLKKTNSSIVSSQK